MDRRVARVGKASGGRTFLSCPKLAQRFGHALQFPETLFPIWWTTARTALFRLSSSLSKRSFAKNRRSQSAALTLGTRGNKIRPRAKRPTIGHWSLVIGNWAFPQPLHFGGRKVFGLG